MKYYRPGMDVPHSGIYEAIHGAAHRLEHEVTIAQGTIFPLCQRCGPAVRFELLRRVHSDEHARVPFGVIFEPFSYASRRARIARAA